VDFFIAVERYSAAFCIERKIIMADVEIKTVYISGIVAGRKYDCQPIQVPSDFPEGWPYVNEAPDPSLKYPAYDWNHHEWIDQDAASQGQQLTSLSDTVKQVKEQVSDLTQKQTDAAQEVKTSAQETNQSLNQIKQMVIMTNTNLAKLISAKSDSNSTDQGGNK
jgi:hypothetical protein